MGAYSIVVDISAQFSGADWPYFALYVDGIAVSGAVPVNTSTPQSIGFSANLADGVAHSIQIVSQTPANSSRFLVVRDIKLQGQTISAQDPLETYVSSQGTVAQTGQMQNGGQVNFNLPATYFGAAAPPNPTPTPAPTPSQTGNDTITVNAAATLAGGVGAHFNLLVDGVKIGEATVGATAQAYNFTTTLATNQAHDIQVVYDNDAIIGGQDRNLLLRSIVIGGQIVSATDPREVLHAPLNPGPGDIVGSGNMYWDGAAEFSLPASFFTGPTPTPPPPPAPPPTPTPTPTPAPSGSDTIVVNAVATLANGIGAHFNLIVDGVNVGDATVGATQQGYSFSTTLAQGQSHDIQIVYDNDAVINGQDRNLLLQSIVINGQTVSATDSREVFHAPSNPGPGNIIGSGNMYWNGTAEFSLPASFFSTPAPAQPPPPPTPAPPPSGAAFYVSVTGNDGGDGSINHPFATLARAQSAMEGSSVRTSYVEGGTFHISSPMLLNGADSGMSFIAYPGQAPILDGGSALSNLMTLNGATGVTLSGLTFANTISGGPAILVANSGGESIIGNHFLNNGSAIGLSNSSNNFISGNEIDNVAQTGIEVYDNSNYNMIDSNVINGVAAAFTSGGGIYMHGANNNTISHNLVENAAGVGIGILNWDNVTINLNNVVSDNRIMNTGSNTPYDTGAIYILGRSHMDTGTTVSNNYIYKAGAPGAAHSVAIYLDDLTSGVDVTNNIIVDPGSYALQIHGGTNINVHNNIFDLGSNTQAIGLVQGYFGSNDFHTDSIRQNIVYSSATTQTLWDWLNLTVSPNNSNSLYWDITGGAFRDTSPFPDNSAKFGDPRFANPGAGDYTLGSGSSAGAIGFQPIDQTVIGPHPTAAHWYT
jgi:parallel beta-helix repeat protein